MTNCTKQKLQEMREFVAEHGDEDLEFLLKLFDVSEKKRLAAYKSMESLRAETRFHQINCAFFKREVNQFMLAMHEIVSLDTEDGRFAEICQRTLQSYEIRAGSDDGCAKKDI